MAGGFITKIMIGMALFGLLTFLGGYFLSDMGNDYGVTQEDFYKNRIDQLGGLKNDIGDIAYDSQELQEAADIDNTAQDVGQLQGAISAEKSKLSTFSVIKDAAKTVNEIMPFNPAITVTLLAILTIAFTAAFYYALRGVLP